MSLTERPSSYSGELDVNHSESVDKGIERLKTALTRRNEYENNLLETLSTPGPVAQGDIQEMWLSLLTAIHDVDAETKRLITERLKSV